MLKVLSRYDHDLVSCFGIICVVTLLAFPSFLNFLTSKNVTRIDYLKITGFFIVQEKYCTVVAIHAILTCTIGLLVLACTESTLAIYACYVCGLFRITSYRLRNAVDNAVGQIVHNRNGSSHSSIPEAVAIHSKSLRIIEESAAMLTIPYLAAIIIAIISFGLNLYRLFLATVDMNSLELIFSGMLVTIHLVIVFLNNYNGQKIIDDSVSVFYETYDTTWYSIPPSMQKLLLMIMRRSSIECAFNLADLFTPSFTGFSTMMSSSFSYFTLLYSTR
ncbi:odorant receptor 22c-like [Hylaeus volcanicus]|uniref:odorant receptor 22c-like n=1 Tax=Hylaeus volcanicus TaxID=313075 RepID=UPI0023B7BE9C|nr:odorant receptor 22c-like [Hylaeus volcanicus]